jgi:ubiquinone/menaquinone biosynthesis C-methylase UbiE
MSVDKPGLIVGADSHDYHTRRLNRRTAKVAAAFFLPYLRPGMRLLDCGCGPGTITTGLVGAVTPGEVVGIDPLTHRLDLARAAAAAQGIENVRFEQGDMHALPFEDGSFDAAFVHAVMEHIGEPVAALAEVRRVLKPGGVIGVRSSTHAEALQWPDSELMRAQMAIFARQKATEGANWWIAPSLREHLRAAGFSRVVGSASVETFGTTEETRQFAGEVVQAVTGSDTMADALVRGFTDADEVARFKDRWLAWGEHTDAFYAATWCEAIGWAD